LLPINLNLRNKKILVIGGGKIALWKIQKLKNHGADIIAMALNFCGAIKKIQNIKLIEREFKASDLKNIFLVIVATNDAKINQQISQLAQKKGILVNVVDDVQKSDFCFSADLQQGNLRIAVSTSGASPRLARLIRDELQNNYSVEFKEFLKFLKKMRTQICSKIIDSRKRQEFWQSNLTPLTLKKIRAGKRLEIQNDLYSTVFKNKYNTP